METTTQEPSTPSNGRGTPNAGKRKRERERSQSDEITLVAKTVQAALTSARAFGGDAEVTGLELVRRGANGFHLWRARYSESR